MLSTYLMGGRKRNSLVVKSNCDSDNQLYGPKQVCWSVALSKLIVANGGTTVNVHVRNVDLSYSTKFYNAASACTGIGSDDAFIYSCVGGVVKKWTSTFGLVATKSLLNGLSFITCDAPDHLLITSSSSGDGHGVRLLLKSDLSTVDSILETGSGDNQFNNPIGCYYVGGYFFVADYANKRVVKLQLSGNELIWDSVPFTHANGVFDVAFDGTYWWVLLTSSTLLKLDSTFQALSPAVSFTISGYSIAIIPDQGDGNGQTFVVDSNSNATLKRYKCSDGTQVGSTVGSSGDGSASLFDPVLTTWSSAQVTFDFGSFKYTTAAGTSHAISWNGFAGYTFPTSNGKCIVTCSTGLKGIRSISANSDGLISISNISKLLCDNFSIQTNPALRGLSIASLGSIVVTYNIAGNSLFTGDLSQVSRVAVSAYLSSCPLLTGCLSDLPASILNFTINSCPLVTPGSIAHCVDVRDFRCHDLGWTTAQVDEVIAAIYEAKYTFTYATGPSLQIGGTNQCPSGSYIAPEEGANWHSTGAEWIALTGKAMIYDLVNNVNSVPGRVLWTITYTA